MAMAGMLSIRGNAEEYDVDSNVAPLMKMVTRLFKNPYSEQNPEVRQKENPCILHLSLHVVS